MDIELKKLAEHRENLSLCCVGALLHNLGKVTSQFFDCQINKNNGNSANFKFQNILHLIEEDYKDLKQEMSALYDALQKPENKNVLDTKTIQTLKREFTLPSPFDDRKYRIGDMIEYLGVADENKKLYSSELLINKIFKNGSHLTHLMNKAHRGASGGEKQNIWVKGQKNPDKMYYSTPFGYEKRHPDLKNIDIIKKQLEELITRYISSGKPVELNKFTKELKLHLEKIVADDQRPLNDVTVWDIGHTGMAFFILQIITLIDKGKVTHDELSGQKDANSLFWRVMSLRIDGTGYLQNVISLADLRTKYEKLKGKFDSLRNVLKKFLTAIEIYSDENGSFYIFPDLAYDHQLTKSILADLQNKMSLDGLKIHYFLSEPLVSHPKDKNGKGYIGNYIFEQINEEMPDKSEPRDYAITNGKEICPICMLRSQEDLKRKSCNICKDERLGVARTWTQELESTIWLDEIADKNGRIALIQGQFDFAHFQMYYPENKLPLRYLKINNLGEPLKPNSKYNINNKEFEWNDSRNILIGEAKDNPPTKFKIKNFPQLNIEIKDIQKFNKDNYRIIFNSPHKQNKDYYLGKAYFKVIDDITLITANQHAIWKVEGMLHSDKFVVINYWDVSPVLQSTSFARIRRVWETTKKFWQDINDGFADIIKNEKRFVIIPKNLNNVNNIYPYHSYEIRFNNSKVSVVWDKDNHRFIIVENLRYFAHINDIDYNKISEYFEKVKQKEAYIEEPPDYGSKTKTLGSFNIEDIEPINIPYIPAIQILSEPRTFMALVPADKALNVIEKIKEKYEKEMGKVRNRLPLHLGVVFAHCKTPLRVILDSGRRMLKERGKPELWEVKDTKPAPNAIKDNHFNECCRLELIQVRNNKETGKTVTWHVPLKMGDGTTDDEWYPYVFIEEDKYGKVPSNRKRVFEAPCPWKNNEPVLLVHAKELEKGDKIYFTPSTLDYQWLDTGGRRFEIAYDEKGQRFDIPQRPYLLDEFDKLQEIWNILSHHLTTTQIHILRNLISSKREEWCIEKDDKVFRQFCRDALAMAQWKKKDDKYPWEKRNKDLKEWLETWTDYAVKGWINDVIEINMQILKRKPEEGGENEY